MEKDIKKIIIYILISWLVTPPNLYSQCWTNMLYQRPAKETSSGRYREAGYKSGYPYTVFDKSKPGWSLDNNIAEIRALIIEDELQTDIGKQEFFQLYSSLYNFALQPYGMQSIGGGATGNSTLAGWAKANAFCYLIKLNASAQDISSNTDTLHLLRANCLTAFDNMNVKVLNCNGGNDCSYLQYRSRELVAWAQAYDLMKAAEILPVNDRSIFCNPRNKLRLLARNFYNASGGLTGIIRNPWGWKKTMV
jgi:hypothetical protein